MNLLEKPFTCPAASGEGEGREDVEAAPDEQEEEHITTLRWTLVPFDFFRNLITRVLPAFDDKLVS